MATTSPDNIYSPNSGSQYALVQDLGAMAQSVQDAISLRSNTYVGTSAQRNAAESEIQPPALWQDSDDIRMLWRRDDVGWVPAVTSWRGSSSQMSSFASSAPEGFSWYNTSDGSEYVMLPSGLWSGMTPLHGSVTLNPPANGNRLQVEIPFPSGYFQTTPSVNAFLIASIPTSTSTQVFASASAVSETGFTLSFMRSTSTSTRVGWVAVPGREV